MDHSAARVRGLSPAAQALYVAIQASNRKNALCVVVVPTDEEVDRFCADLNFFLGSLEGATSATLDEVVKPFPSLQTDPYQNIAPHFGVASARAAALHAMANGTARVVVASGPALLPRLNPPEGLRATSIDVKTGMDLDPLALGDLLADAGFTREDPVDAHGEFCVRGGIVDWFPAGAEYPIRVEFVGDNVESIRRYDPGTQRSIGTLDQASVVPVTENTGSDPDLATFFDYVGSRDLTFIISEEEDVAAHAKKLTEQISASYDTAKNENPGALAPGQLFLGWSEVEERLTHGTRLDQLAIDSEPPLSAEASGAIGAPQKGGAFRGQGPPDQN